MTTYLQRNFRRNNKGISTIIGMMFFLLIVMIIFANFTVILNENTGLEQTTMQTQQIDNIAAREQLRIYPIQGNSQFLFYNSGSTTLTVSCIINNTSTFPVQIVRLWIKDQSTNNVGSLSIPSTEGIFQQNEVKTYNEAVKILISDLSKTVFWFVTARGNQFNQYTNQGPTGATGQPGVNGTNGIDSMNAIGALTAQGIGSISLDFKSFRTYHDTVTTGNNGCNSFVSITTRINFLYG